MVRRTILTAAVTALAVAAGAAPALAQGPGGGRGGFRGGFGGFGGGMAGLLRMPEVQKELKLDEAQIDLLEGLNRGGGRPNFEEFRNLSPEQMQQRMAEMRAQREKQIQEILDPKQFARLRQLEIQQAGIRSLDQKYVQDQLKMTADQRQKVTAALQSEREGMRGMFQGFQPGGEPPSQEQRQQMFENMQKLRTGTDTKLTAILTAQQKTQFEQLKGAPFKFPEPRFGPGGPGGFGGRRGGGGGADRA